MALSDERAAWSCKQGDHFTRSWTCAASGRTWDFDTLLVQVWTVNDGAPDTLFATSEADPAEGVAEIDTTGSEQDGTAVTIAMRWQTPEDATVGHEYVIEAQCEIDDDVDTFLEHGWEVLQQFARPTAEP